MFNFTTQTVYNAIATSGSGKNMWVSSNSKAPALRIGNTRFDKADILDILVKNPTVENLASVTFDVSGVIPGENDTVNEVTARIALYLGLNMSSQDSFYANDLVYKGKPLYVEFFAKKGEDASTVAARVKAIADKYMLFTAQEKILDVSVSSGEVTFTGVSGYQVIKKAALQVFNPSAKTVSCCENQGDYEDLIVGVPVIYTTDATGVVTVTETKVGEDGTAVALAENETGIAPGIEAFGDYNWIIHNLRLPTAANTNFWSPTRIEMPAPGVQYTQFIVRILKDRDGIAGEVVGERATSVTNHVLYVAGLKTTAGSAAKAVNDAFTTLLGADASTKMKTEADTALQTPFA